MRMYNLQQMMCVGGSNDTHEGLQCSLLSAEF